MTINDPIYLDYHAHAPIDPRVVSVLTHALNELDANPHSSHRHGQRARDAVEACRRDVASLVGVEASEIVLLSGATEANNLAIRGLAATIRAGDQVRLLIGAGEHPSVIAAAEAVPNARIDLIPLNAEGTADLAALDRLLEKGADIVSVAGANHEIGTIQPLSQISQRARAAGAILHSDLAQCAGKIPIDGTLLDAASVSAHKFGGPVGIGALVIRRRLRRRLQPMMVGGGQEGGLRAGTVAPALCAAFGAACRIAIDEMDEEARRVAGLRDELHASLAAVGGLFVNGGAPKLPGNLNISFADVDGEALVMRVGDRVSISTGSACTSTSLSPSHVLAAIGVTGRRAEGAIRLGLGRSTTAAEVAETARIVTEAVIALRATLRRVA